MRMAGKSGPNSGGRGNLIPNNSFLKTCTTTDRRTPRHRERMLEHSIRTDEANQGVWLEFHYQPGDPDSEPQAVMRIFQINDAERAILALAHLGIVCCQC